MNKLSRSKVIESMKDSFGNQSVMARRCNVDRAAITIFLNKNPDIREMIEHEKEKLIDVAELGLVNKINEGSDRAIEFFLKTKGKKRGYVEKSEVESLNTNVNVEVETDKQLAIVIQKIRDGTPN